MLTIKGDAAVVFVMDTPWFIAPSGKLPIQQMEDFLHGKAKRSKTKREKEAFEFAASILGRAKQNGGDLELLRHSGGLKAIVSFSSTREMLNFCNIASDVISGYALLVSLMIPKVRNLDYKTVEEAEEGFSSRQALIRNPEQKKELKRVACMFKHAKECEAGLERISQSETGKLQAVFSLKTIDQVKRLEKELKELCEQ